MSAHSILGLERAATAERSGQPISPRAASEPSLEAADQLLLLWLVLLCAAAILGLCVVLWYRRRPCKWNLRPLLWSISISTLVAYAIAMGFLFGTHRL